MQKNPYIHNIKCSQRDLKCKHSLPAQLWSFTPSTPQWLLFLSVFVVWAVCICSLGFVCLSFFSSSSFLFHLSAKEKGKETGLGRTRLCNRSCPLKIQLEQKFSVADSFKTDVSFIIMQKQRKTEKKEVITSSQVLGVLYHSVSHFSF